MIDGRIEAGPNAVLAFAREGYSKARIVPLELLETLSYDGFWRLISKHWKTGMGEMMRSFSKSLFTRALQDLVPAICKMILSGVAQGCVPKPWATTENYWTISSSSRQRI